MTVQDGILGAAQRRADEAARISEQQERERDAVLVRMVLERTARNREIRDQVEPRYREKAERRLRSAVGDELYLFLRLTQPRLIREIDSGSFSDRFKVLSADVAEWSEYDCGGFCGIQLQLEDTDGRVLGSVRYIPYNDGSCSFDVYPVNGRTFVDDDGETHFLSVSSLPAYIAECYRPPAPPALPEPRQRWRLGWPRRRRTQPAIEAPRVIVADPAPVSPVRVGQTSVHILMDQTRGLRSRVSALDLPAAVSAAANTALDDIEDRLRAFARGEGGDPNSRAACHLERVVRSVMAECLLAVIRGEQLVIDLPEEHERDAVRAQLVEGFVRQMAAIGRRVSGEDPEPEDAVTAALWDSRTMTGMLEGGPDIDGSPGADA